MKFSFSTAMLIACVASVNAQQVVNSETKDVSALKEKKESFFDWGADIRARYDFADNLPNKGFSEMSEGTDYARLRTRLWGSIKHEDFESKLRLANEFRYYRRPNSNRKKQEFPDVLFVDSLYVKQKNLFGFLDVQVGRQDMKFGAGRIISDGTGGDGSRSSYFDALRLTFHYGEKSTVDSFGLYVADEDWLPTLGETKDGSGVSSDYDPTGFGGNSEAGIGIYLQHREKDDLPFDLYYVYKDESNGGKISARRTHTAGFRVLPQFTDELSGELELAVQRGDIENGDSFISEMAYAGLTYKPKETEWKPSYTIATLYYSGDENKNEGWNPVFNRSTGIGESIAPLYEKYRYTNLIYPHALIAFAPAKLHKVEFELGPMFAAKKDSEMSGSFIGTFARTKYSFPIVDHLKGSISAEYLAKGNSFEGTVDRNAWFMRFELTATF